MALPLAPTRFLDEIAATRDSQRSGAIDVDWNGSRGSIYFVFGQPSHATFAPEGGDEVAGDEALERLLTEVPGDAAVGSWRRVMIPEESLRISIDDLYRRFTQRNGGAAAPDAAAPPRSVVPFRLDGFPILPQGTSLWSDAAANVVHLDMLAPQLPNSLIVLTAPESRAVAVVSRGVIVDAVWVSDSLGLLGDAAARALMNSGEGTVSGYALDDDRLLLSLPLLWRASRSITGIHAEWLDTDRMLADLRAQGRSCAILVDGAAQGVALVDGGALVATYTPHRRRPSSSPASLRSLLRTPGARVTIATLSRDTPDAPVVDEAVADGRALGIVAAVPVFAAPSTLDTALPAVEPVVDDGPGATSAPPGQADAAVTRPQVAADEAAQVSVDADTAETTAPDVVADVPTFLLPPHTASESRTDGSANGRGGAGNGAVIGDSTPSAPRSGRVGRIGKLRGLRNGRGSQAVPEPPPRAPFPSDVFALPDLTPSASPYPPAPPAVESELDWSVVEATATVDAAEPGGALAPEPDQETAVDGPPPVATAGDQVDPHDYVTPRLDFDVAALRIELVDIATAWLGPDDVAPIAALINAARPGVDEFVGTIAAISALPVPGHESAVVRAMAREMHFRAAEVLCGV